VREGGRGLFIELKKDIAGWEVGRNLV